LVEAFTTTGNVHSARFVSTRVGTVASLLNPLPVMVTFFPAQSSSPKEKDAGETERILGTAAKEFRVRKYPKKLIFLNHLS
jgi:hypothetical protein